MFAPLVGKLLIASTTMEEPLYVRGVCLVVHEDEHRTIGVMLNRPMLPSPQALLQLMIGGAESEPSDTTTLAAKANRVPEADRSTIDEATLANASGSLGLVHFGGPLSGPVVAVHGSSDLAEAETGQGIYVAAQKQNLESLVRHKPSPYRLIVGHLGWEPDQLTGEIEAGIWHLVPATADIVFDSDQEMWPRLVRRATAHSLARWIGTPDVPAAEQLN